MLVKKPSQRRQKTLPKELEYDEAFPLPPRTLGFFMCYNVASECKGKIRSGLYVLLLLRNSSPFLNPNLGSSFAARSSTIAQAWKELGFHHAAARSSFECVRHKKHYGVHFSSAMRRRWQDFFFGKRLLRFPGDDFLGLLGHRIRELGTYSMCAVSPTKRPQLQSYFEATGMGKECFPQYLLLQLCSSSLRLYFQIVE